MGILDYFTPEARRGNRQALEGLLMQFIPPEMRPQLNLLSELNPVVSMERAGQDAQQLFAPDQTLMDRLAAGGRMASNMAGVLAPAMVAGRAGVPVANAVRDVLTGYAPMVQPFMADEFGGVPLSGAADAATQQGSEIINLLRSGRAGEVTEQMLDMGDPVLNARLSEYLYSNYDLPMDAASRMGRAGGMGFVDALHGTGDQITAVDPSFFGSGQDLLGSGFYTTTAPARAERYVPREKSPGIEVSKNYAEGGNILPLSVREPMPFDLKEPLGKTADDIANYYANDPFFSIEKTSSGVTYVKDFDGNSVMLDPMQPKHWALQNLRKAFGPSETSNALSDLGFSGVSGPELGGNVVRNSYNPTDVRSRFARFDPRLSHLRNLNAGLATGVPLGLLAMQPDQGPQ